MHLKWLAVAEDCHDSSLLLVRSNLYRSSVSRFYYSAFSAATAILHYSGQAVPPMVDQVQRETWSHDVTPKMISTHRRRAGHTAAFWSEDEAMKSARLLQRLYKYRVLADYSVSQPLSQQDCLDASKEAGRILKVAQAIIKFGGS